MMEYILLLSDPKIEYRRGENAILLTPSTKIPAEGCYLNRTDLLSLYLSHSLSPSSPPRNTHPASLNAKVSEIQ